MKNTYAAWLLVLSTFFGQVLGVITSVLLVRRPEIGNPLAVFSLTFVVALAIHASRAR